VRLRRSNPEAFRIAREIVELRAQLLKALADAGDDVEMTVESDGDELSVRVIWKNCVLIANQTQRERATARRGTDAKAAGAGPSAG